MVRVEATRAHPYPGSAVLDQRVHAGGLMRLMWVPSPAICIGGRLWATGSVLACSVVGAAPLIGRQWPGVGGTSSSYRQHVDRGD